MLNAPGLLGRLGGVSPRAGGGSPGARFVGGPFVEGTNDSSVTIRFRNMTPGSTYEYEASSSGGGTPVTDTGTSPDVNFDVTGVDLTGLSPGSVTLTATQDAVPISGASTLLLPPFDNLLLESGDNLLLESGDLLLLDA